MKKLIYFLKQKRLLTLVNILFWANMSFAQQTIKGIVSDVNNQPIIGANVIVKGSNKGDNTDTGGRYSITAKKGSVLVFNYIGFKTKEVVVNGQTTINVVLQDDTQSLDEVVVTGVFDKRKRMESSVAISVLNSAQIQRQAPTSSADLLKNIPGVYVNSAAGEINNKVTTRGFEGTNGYYYVSMQEDGLPVTGAQYTNYSPDSFLRPDVMLDKLEAVRGGTASILGNNAPGGIFNYVSKTGGSELGGEVRVKYGFEGNNTKNIYYRTDLALGGPLSKDKSLRFNVGGFYRENDGARYAGYKMNEGGQIRGNLTKKTRNGSVTLFVKYLNDKNAFLDFMPTVDFKNPRLAPGVNVSTSFMVPPITAEYKLNESNMTQKYDSSDKIHNKDASIGLNFDFKLGKGFSIDNKVRVSDKSTYWNSTALPFPTAVDQIAFYGINGWASATGVKFGRYTFSDVATGNQLLTVDLGFGPQGLKFTTNGSLPGEAIQKNSLIFNPLLVTDNRVKELVEQMTINKKVKNMNFTGGLYYVNSTVDRTSTGAGNAFTQMTAGYPRATAITYTDSSGKTYQMTNSDGVIGGGNKSNPASIFDVKFEQIAGFLGHNWAITPKLNLDWGMRYESINVKGTNQIGTLVTLPVGGTDGDPLTQYDETGGKITSVLNYDKNVKTFSYSAGLNYLIGENFAVFGRFSAGNKAPDLSMYMSVNNGANASFLNPVAQETKQYELGIKFKRNNMNLNVTPFYSILGNIPVQALGQETSDLSSIYSTPMVYNESKTVGVELEGNYAFTKNLSLRAVATFQKSTAVHYNVWNIGANGSADDKLVNYDGNENKNIPRTIMRISPTYTIGKFLASVDWSYMGARQANIANAFVLPAFNQTNLNLRYSINEKVSIQANINNLFNQYGVMDWSAPGGFPATLNTDGFTKAQLETNPNAIYYTTALQPRAYFLTASYKF